MQQEELFPDKDETSLLAAFAWWEKRRLHYHLIVGLVGLAFVFMIGFENVDSN